MRLKKKGNQSKAMTNPMTIPDSPILFNVEVNTNLPGAGVDKI